VIDGLQQRKEKNVPLKRFSEHGRGSWSIKKVSYGEKEKGKTLKYFAGKAKKYYFGNKRTGRERGSHN